MSAKLTTQKVLETSSKILKSPKSHEEPVKGQRGSARCGHFSLSVSSADTRERRRLEEITAWATLSACRREEAPDSAAPAHLSKSISKCNEAQRDPPLPLSLSARTREQDEWCHSHKAASRATIEQLLLRNNYSSSGCWCTTGYPGSRCCAGHDYIKLPDCWGMTVCVCSIYTCTFIDTQVVIGMSTTTI